MYLSHVYKQWYPTLLNWSRDNTDVKTKSEVLVFLHWKLSSTLALMPYLIMLTIHKNITCCCRLQLWMMALLKRMHFVFNTYCLVQMNSPNFASLLFFTCAYISWTSFCENRYRKFAYAASKDFASSLLLFLLNQLLGEAFAFIILQWFNHSIFLGKALFILCDW